MLRLGQVINPQVVSALNKLASTSLEVPERVAFRNFVKFAQPATREWNELLASFKDKIAEKDPKTLADLEEQWAKEVDVARLPVSVVDKVALLSPNEESALLDICEVCEKAA